MRIDEISVYAVENRLVTPFKASSHSTQKLIHLIVRLRSGDFVGWGECPTLEDPYYLGETTTTALHVLEQFLIPSVLGKDFPDVEAFVAAYPPVKYNTFAKCGLEAAAWDMFGRATGKSVASMLGGMRSEIVSGVSLGIEKDFGLLSELVDRYLAEGYRRVKLKIAPGWDVGYIAKVRERYPDVPLMVDANSAYTLNDVAHLKQLDAFNLSMIEQPLAWDDVIDHATLQREIQTPVCLDESIRTVAAARHAIDLASCKIINVKVARVGGLLEAKRVHDECHRRGVPVWCGGMHDYGPGRAANIALSSLEGFSIPGDVSGFDKYFLEDIVEPPIVAKNGAIPVPTGPGIGYEVVERRVLARACDARRFLA